MLDETIKAVKDAEQKSGVIVQEAEQQAAGIISQAEEEASEWKKQQLLQAQTEAERLLDEEKKKGEELFVRSAAESQKQIAEVKETASRKEGEAVRLVISQIMN
ncbi:MAG: hypothetical protein ACOX8H_12150 [Ruminococcus sp.]